MSILILLEIIILFFTLCSKFRFKYNGVILNNKDDSTNNIIFLFLTSSILVFFGALRGAFTIDYTNYVNLFHYLGNQSFNDLIMNYDSYHSELLFNILNKIVYMVTHNEQFLLALLSFFTVIIYLKAIQKESKDVSLSIFMFLSTGLYFTSFNIIRQILSAVIILWGAKFLYKSNYFKFLIIVILAFSIHKTALISLLFIPLCSIKYSKRNLKIFLLFAISITILCFTNTDKITLLFSNLLYNDYDSVAYGIANGVPITSLILPIIMLFTIICMKKNINLKYKKHKMLLISFALYTFFSLISLKIEMGIRFANIFCLFLCELFPEMFINRSYRVNENYKILFVLILFVFSLFSSAARLSYTFFWNN